MENFWKSSGKRIEKKKNNQIFAHVNNVCTRTFVRRREVEEGRGRIVTRGWLKIHVVSVCKPRAVIVTSIFADGYIYMDTVDDFGIGIS